MIKVFIVIFVVAALGALAFLTLSAELPAVPYMGEAQANHETTKLLGLRREFNYVVNEVEGSSEVIEHYDSWAAREGWHRVPAADGTKTSSWSSFTDATTGTGRCIHQAEGHWASAGGEWRLSIWLRKYSVDCALPGSSETEVFGAVFRRWAATSAGSRIPGSSIRPARAAKKP